MTPHYKKFLEGHANTLRDKCNVPAFGRLDPFALAKRMEMEVLMLNNECGVPSEICEHLLENDPRAWSAGTLPLPDGRVLVVMNPTHEIERQRATLMEEIAHIYLRHKPTQLVRTDGVMFRSWNKSNESQAYWVGAAALLPERILKGARTRGMSVEELAHEQGVSVPLVRFRAGLVGIRLHFEHAAAL